MDDLIHKHLISEEQEIIDCILNGPLHESIRDWRTGRRRLHGLVRCKKHRDKIKNLECKIQVYEKYITVLSRELVRHTTPHRKKEVESKILAAKERIIRWKKVIATAHSIKSKNININKQTNQVLKQKLKVANKDAKKGNLWGFRV